jgi:hypothetical protein
MEGNTLMAKFWFTLFIPPMAACKYGCKSCCAAPIGVFWLTAIVAILYGLIWGGPTEGTGLHTAVVGLGLWIVASVWAWFVVRGADADRCKQSDSSWCSTILPNDDDTDPMDEIRKAR